MCSIKEIMEQGCGGCDSLITLYRHPWNKRLGKGSIMKKMGYVCISPDEESPEGFHAMFFDRIGGGCEMFTRRKRKLNGSEVNKNG